MYTTQDGVCVDDYLQFNGFVPGSPSCLYNKLPISTESWSTLTKINMVANSPARGACALIDYKKANYVLGQIYNHKAEYIATALDAIG